MEGHSGHVGQEEEEDFINFPSSFLISYLLEKIKKKEKFKKQILFLKRIKRKKRRKKGKEKS
jgi:hypothetical protein